MSQQRYAIRAVADRRAVIDTTTGTPAVVNDRLQVGLTNEEAENLVSLLNRMEARRPKLSSAKNAA